MLVTVRDVHPKIGPLTWVAPNATIIGDVEIGKNCSIWFNAVLRGDVYAIRVGDETNIQDGVIVHGSYEKCGTTLGRRVTVGHGVILHGCQVGDRSLIGMGSILMDESIIGKQCLVAAGSLVTEGSKFQDGQLILGRPAKAVRPLTKEEIQGLELSADGYIQYKNWYQGVV